MRELSYVKKLKINFSGSVTKRALTIGDADNDEHNELICANLQGDLAIFKGHDCNKFAYASGLGMITACAIGDIININKNFVVIINMEGWLFIFNVSSPSSIQDDNEEDSFIVKSEAEEHKCKIDTPKLSCGLSSGLSIFYQQRMPANCKEILMADLDGDGQNELIIGLTDRVLRTYKWVDLGLNGGKFVGLYKWEFADQIGSVSLNPSRKKDCVDIIVAQPGGTYARLECFDKKPHFTSVSYAAGSNAGSSDQKDTLCTDRIDPRSRSFRDSHNVDGDENVKTEYISKLTPEYHQLGITQMRNHHISTEVLGGIKDGKDSNSYSSLVLATLDGTLMLVNKDKVLWSLQVDHQLFALAVIEHILKVDPHLVILTQSESTCTIVPASECAQQGPSAPDMTKNQAKKPLPTLQYFVVCAWDGKTYIIDDERNYLRFKFDEAVSAFTAGNYYFDGEHHPVLVYATFNNQLVIYYDVVSENIRPKFFMDEIVNNPQHQGLLEKLKKLTDKLDLKDDGDDKPPQYDTNSEILYNLVQGILYGITDEQLS